MLITIRSVRCFRAILRRRSSDVRCREGGSSERWRLDSEDESAENPAAPEDDRTEKNDWGCRKGYNHGMLG